MSEPVRDKRREDIFNEAEMLRRMMDDRDLAKELLPQYYEEMAKHIRAIREAHQAGNMDKVFRSAHSIKGASANVSAHGLKGVAQAIEKAGKDGQADKVVELLPELDRQYEKLGEAFRRTGYIP